MTNYPNYQIQPKSIYKVRAVPSLGETLLYDLKTLLEMRRRFPSIVLMPIPRPLDQVL
jgi:hypothetical protein